MDWWRVYLVFGFYIIVEKYVLVNEQQNKKENYFQINKV